MKNVKGGYDETLKDKITVTESLLLIDNEIFGADGRLLAKCWNGDVAEILLNRLNSQSALLKACEDDALLANIAIAETPTSDLRNKLTEINIRRLAAIAKTKKRLG